MGLVDLLWTDGSSPDGLSARRRDVERDHGPESYSGDSPTLRGRGGRGTGSLYGRLSGDGGLSPHFKEPIAVGLDGGYVRDWDQKQRHFEVIVGKSVPSDQPAKCFGFVQTYDTKPKRRLGEVL